MKYRLIYEFEGPEGDHRTVLLIQDAGRQVAGDVLDEIEKRTGWSPRHEDADRLARVKIAAHTVNTTISGKGRRRR
ncbi:MAG: hypothetical protein GY722_20370 [bacterium]|nr:hypothetical protein [bacterium]